MTEMERGTPLVLNGSPFERGRAQAATKTAEPVVDAINLRLAEKEAVLKLPATRDYLSRQWDFAAAQSVEELAEMTGVADGFGIDPRELFAFLHLGIAADLARSEGAADGCSAWALRDSEEGPAVGKNRDFRGEHAGLQRVFLHADPSWPGGRKVLCVGSLGSPGVYSSGINSEGLALADTAIATTDHGVGWLRYFLMTRLLSRHATVAEALDDLGGMVHAGGGSMVLADAGGAVAAVDLGHSKVPCEADNGAWIARTNHFGSASVAGAPDAADSSSDSHGRLNTLQGVLKVGQNSLTALRRVMASHDHEGVSGLCRHAVGGDSRTLSGAVFACRSRLLYFCSGNPCDTEWMRYSIE